MREIDALRQPTALRLLTIWRECGQETDDPLERSLLANAQVLAESCYFQNEPVFSDGLDVLETMTTREMEEWIGRLCGGWKAAAAINPAFDRARFDALREG